jgi:hypothetical protein
MQQRFRRGASSIGPARCDGCDRTMLHGEVYLAIDEKPSDKYKEETVFIDEVDCGECSNKIEDGEHYMISIEGDSEKVYCHSCLKKKGGESYRKKNSGAMVEFVKSRAISKDLRFCQECCEKRKAGMEKKEKGEKVFTFFVSKTGK